MKWLSSEPAFAGRQACLGNPAIFRFENRAILIKKNSEIQHPARFHMAFEKTI